MSKELLGEALRDLVIEKLTEKAARTDRSKPKSRLKAEAYEAMVERLGAVDLWTRVPPRARQPRLSRADLAATALRIADADGIRALSMRRLAAELDVGTMTLYHYVRTKNELLTLVIDAVMGEVVLPPDVAMPSDWRAALTLIAKRSLAAFERHPWMLDCNDDPPLGPNSVRHFDQTLHAVSSLDLPLASKIDIVALIDEYTFGYALQHRNTSAADSSATEDTVIEYASVLLETGAYPELSALTEHRDLRSVWREVWGALRDPDRFERNLNRLFDGIEASLHTTR